MKIHLALKENLEKFKAQKRELEYENDEEITQFLLCLLINQLINTETALGRTNKKLDKILGVWEDKN